VCRYVWHVPTPVFDHTRICVCTFMHTFVHMLWFPSIPCTHHPVCTGGLNVLEQSLA
jgi:hypothetical protein